MEAYRATTVDCGRAARGYLASTFLADYAVHIIEMDDMINDNPYRLFVHIETGNHFNLSRRLTVHIGRHVSGNLAAMLTPGGGQYLTDADSEPGKDYVPALRCSEDELRALFVELNRFFDGGADDTRALRKDYDAERSRVDKMIDALIKDAQ